MTNGDQPEKGKPKGQKPELRKLKLRKTDNWKLGIPAF
jgi:hypothetical protein